MYQEASTEVPITDHRSSITTLVFDIETGPLPEADLEGLVPEFDLDSVRVGNLKDPVKINAKIAEAKVKARERFFKDAALDALTGRVLAVGVAGVRGQESGVRGQESGARGQESGRANMTPDPCLLTPSVTILGDDDEATLLQRFWDLIRSPDGRIHRLVGFNIIAFDLPFLIRRSWRHGVQVPLAVRDGRYWAPEITDLRLVWQLGDRHASGSLDAVAKHLGVGQKNGDGAEFARLWKEDRGQAIAYLTNDVELTAKVAGVLGVVSGVRCQVSACNGEEDDLVWRNEEM